MNRVKPGEVTHLVVARDIKHIGDVHDIYNSRDEAESALSRYFEIGASSAEMYECKLVPQNAFVNYGDSETV